MFNQKSNAKTTNWLREYVKVGSILFNLIMAAVVARKKITSSHTTFE